MEALENRCLLAQVLFGGNVLRETFDDIQNIESPPGTPAVTDLEGYVYLNGTDGAHRGKMDDRGSVCAFDPALGTTTCQQTPAVFRHTFSEGSSYLEPRSGTTTASLPGKTHSMFLRYGTDFIKITPYLPPGATTAEVALASIDVSRSKYGALVSFMGRNGQVSLRGPDLATSPPQPRLISNNPPGCGANGCLTAILGPPAGVDYYLGRWTTFIRCLRAPARHRCFTPATLFHWRARPAPVSWRTTGRPIGTPPTCRCRCRRSW